MPKINIGTWGNLMPRDFLGGEWVKDIVYIYLNGYAMCLPSFGESMFKFNYPIIIFSAFCFATSK